jgi:hypothetical protein
VTTTAPVSSSAANDGLRRPHCATFKDGMPVGEDENVDPAAIRRYRTLRHRGASLPGPHGLVTKGTREPMIALRRMARVRCVAGFFLSAAPLVFACAAALAGQLTMPYIDPTYFTSIPFGTHSHWAQPWRSYMETTPAAVFVDGTGINFNVNSRQADNVAAMLARHGIHHARVEIGWRSFDYDHEDRLNDSSIAPKLAALRHNGLRPLILLNANSGAPCPIPILRKTVVRNAARGDRMLELDSVDGLTPGYSGLPHLGEDYGTWLRS